MAWNFDARLVLPLLLVAAGYRLGVQRIQSSGYPNVARAQEISLYAGLLAIAVALIGPLDSFNSDLFLLHMAQHMVLILVAVPLILLGRPVQVVLRAVPLRYTRSLIGPLLRPRGARRTLNVLVHPLFVLLLFNANLVVWHMPEFYVAALEDQRLHELEHAAFLATALLFWWVIIDPVPRHHKVSPHAGILMLFISGSVGDLIGLALAISPRVLYPFYQAAANPWGISALTDQRIAGLIMLISGTLVFFGCIFRQLTEPLPPSRPSRSSPAQEAA